MKKILFLIGSLGGGGAERSLLELVRNIDSKKYEITVKTIFNNGVYIDEIKKYAKYKTIINIKNNNNFIIISQLLRLVTKIMTLLSNKTLYRLFIREKSDIEIAFLEGLSTKIISGSSNRLSTKLAWVHTDPIQHPWSSLSYSSIEEERNAYLKFDKIFSVSNSVKNSFMNKYDLNSSVQFNIIDHFRILEQAEHEVSLFTENSVKNIIAVGRLVPQKGYHRLLKVHKQLIEEDINHMLYIIGEGVERLLLEDYINKHSLANSVKLLGFQNNPYKYMSKCDIFVSSSTVEGLSTVATEAIILGLPIVTTDCAGMTDLLGESEYGLITENSELGLYEGLKKMLINKSIYNMYKEKIVERKENFKLEKRVAEYEEIFDSILLGNNKLKDE